MEALGRRIVAAPADVRDIASLTKAVDGGVGELGRLDIVVANAGIFTFGQRTHEIDEQSWQDLMDINITGVWHTYKAAAEHVIAAGEGGSIIIIFSSLAPAFAGLNPMGEAWIAPKYVSNVVAWLASDESFFVSGAQIPVDAAAAVQ